MNMDISIITCTFNRSESIKDTLNSVLVQKNCKEFNYEVIVVDNNSTDNTKKVIEEYIPAFNGRLRYIFEPRQGKSYALNTGISNSKYEIIAIIDDDETAHSEWLYNLHKTFVDYNADMVGGKILFNWDQKKPGWIPQEALSVLGFLDYGKEPFRIISKEHVIFGGNLAFVKACRNGHLFQEKLGIKKGNSFIAGGEDIHFFLESLSMNHTIIYQPSAVIYHKVFKERATKAYFRKWYYRYAQANILRTLDTTKPKILFCLFSLLRSVIGLVNTLLAYLKWLIFKPAFVKERFQRELWFFHHLGTLAFQLKLIRMLRNV